MMRDSTGAVLHEGDKIRFLRPVFGAMGEAKAGQIGLVDDIDYNNERIYVTPTDDLNTITGYLHIIDTHLQSVVKVGGAGGPRLSAARRSARVPLTARPDKSHHTGHKNIAAQLQEAFKSTGVSKALNRYSFDAVPGHLHVTDPKTGAVLSGPMAAWYDDTKPRIAMYMKNGTAAVLSLTKSGFSILAQGAAALNHSRYGEAFNNIRRG